LNLRQQAIINILLAGFNEKLTTTVYAKLTHCSRDTALRDLTNLLSQNVFIKNAGKGKNTEYLLNFPLKKYS
jgi:Fic family protein